MAKQRWRLGIRVAVLVCAGGCTDAMFLDTGDVLIASFDPAGHLYVSGAASMDCAEGATVLLSAHHGDGTAAKQAIVQLWLTGSTTATLSKGSVTLSDDGTDGSVCLRPGPVAGTTTLHARSGPIDTTQTIDVRDRTVASDGMLMLIVPQVAILPAPTSMCGAPVTGCGAPVRGTAITVQASGTAANPVPVGAVVALATSRGVLSASPCGMAPSPEQKPLSVALENGQAGAFVCFDDSGGTGMVTARSGSVTQSATLTIAPVLHGITLDPNRTAAAVGDKATLTGFAVDCAGQGVSGIPVELQIESGGFDLDQATTVVAKTGADGSVTYAGTVRAVPLRAKISALGQSQVSCETMVAAAGAP